MTRKPKKPAEPPEPADAEIDPLIERFLRKAQVSAILNGEGIAQEDFHVAKLLHELKLRRQMKAEYAERRS